MPLFSHIVRSLYIIRADKKPDAEGWNYCLYLVVSHKGRTRIRERVQNADMELIGKKCRNKAAVVLAGNSVVVNKVYQHGSQFVSSITGNTQEFVSASEDTGSGNVRLVFMRRTVYEELRGNFPWSIASHLPAFADVLDEIKKIGDEFFCVELRLRNIMNPGTSGSALANIVFRRLLMPVLTVVFAALFVNFFVNSSLNNRVARQQLELAAMSREKSAINDNAKERNSINYRGQTARYPYSAIADDIASRVPDGIMLTHIAINPLSKKIVADKPVTIEFDTVAIDGETVRSEDVALFVSDLESSFLYRRAKVKSLDRSRNNKFVFRIELQL